LSSVENEQSEIDAVLCAASCCFIGRGIAACRRAAVAIIAAVATHRVRSVASVISVLGATTWSSLGQLLIVQTVGTFAFQ